VTASRKRSALVGAALFAGVLVVFLLLLLFRSHTPSIRTPNGIAVLKAVKLGGDDQWVLIRGNHRHNPVLLFLHGGPGMPAMYLAHAFQRPLEEDYTVVQWDRRGAGKSYRADTPPGKMTTEHELADTRQLIALLQRELPARHVVLAGHSYGTYLGMIYAWRHPDDIAAYIGIGQISWGDDEAHAVQDRWLARRAEEAGDQELLRLIRSAAQFDREEAIFRYGGGLRGATSFRPLLWTGLRAPEYSILDALKVPRGVAFTHRHIKYDSMSGPLAAEVRAVSVPVYFATGRYDYIVPQELTARYLEMLAAPRKEMLWFERSAHFPFLQEPEKFARELRRIKQTLPP
jgi:pimeloyl-ACP methyl ester carboxylesterase